MQKRKREEEYMRQIGFVPHANEDNNGNPVVVPSPEDSDGGNE